jgi:transcriptional regulator with XRE-family HTH domain
MEELGLKLRSLRKERGLSLVRVSEPAGCTPSYLSMVENGKVDPSISRLKRIAEALGITIVDLFQKDTDHKVVMRKKDRIKGEIPRSKTDIEILIPRIDDKQLDARLAIIHPGGSSRGNYKHPGEEFGLVLKGIFELSVDGTIYKLDEGDSFYFKSTSNHNFSNPSTEDTVVLWVNHPPSW